MSAAGSRKLLLIPERRELIIRTLDSFDTYEIYKSLIDQPGAIPKESWLDELERLSHLSSISRALSGPPAWVYAILDPTKTDKPAAYIDAFCKNEEGKFRYPFLSFPLESAISHSNPERVKMSLRSLSVCFGRCADDWENTLNDPFNHRFIKDEAYIGLSKVFRRIDRQLEVISEEQAKSICNRS